MKRIGIALTTAVLLAACNIEVLPGPAPGTPVIVDDPNGAQATIAPSRTHRFELTVGTEPVRVDVYHQEATADGELYVKVFDGANAAYAHTDRRDLFAGADAALTSLGVSAQDVDVSFPYSVNLPRSMGKVYLEVTNKTGGSAQVTVKAVARNEVVRDGFSMNAPSGGATAVGYGGAVLFLGQRDTYTYQGASNQLIRFTPTDAANAVGLKAVLNPGQPSETELAAGVDVNLLPGDRVEVFAEGNARAGFCQNLSGCADGIVTGEYGLTIH